MTHEPPCHPCHIQELPLWRSCPTVTMSKLTPELPCMPYNVVILSPILEDIEGHRGQSKNRCYSYPSLKHAPAAMIHLHMGLKKTVRIVNLNTIDVHLVNAGVVPSKEYTLSLRLRLRQLFLRKRKSFTVPACDQLARILSHFYVGVKISTCPTSYSPSWKLWKHSDKHQ